MSTTPVTRDDLLELQRDYEAKLAALQRRIAPTPRPQPARRRAARPRRLLAMTFAILLAGLLPLGLLAAVPFNDLNPGSVHNANIEAIADAGITKGCDPGVAYCPNGLVTREEMASFLARAAGLGNNPPVANAKTAQTATTATTAQSTARLQGRAADELVRAASASNTETHDINFATPTFTEAATVTLSAPGPGFVLVIGAVNGRVTDPSCTGTPAAHCEVVARLRDAAPGAVAPPALSVDVNATTSAASLSPVFLFTASAAGSHTYILELSTNDLGAGRVEFSSPTITALFVPFGAGGQTP